jgi:hypothetical protein
MKNVTITELNAHDDIWFDQDIDTDTVIASDGAVAVNGDVEESVLNTGTNTGIIAGGDVELDDSIIGHGNTQLNDSEIGAYADHGVATNIEAEGHVNTGSGDLLDVDAYGDAQVVTGHGNEVVGDVEFDAEGADGPINFALGDGNHQQALEDNSTEINDSFNTDNSVEDSFNTSYQDSFNSTFEDNDSSTTLVEDSFNSEYEDNDSFSETFQSSWDDHSVVEDNDTWMTEIDNDVEVAEVWGEGNDVELDA